MFLSEEWASYWRDLPPMKEYFDAVLTHEIRFTEHFTSRGYTVDAVYPSDAYPTDHPALFNPDLLIDDGCPLVKRRPFFHYPPFLDRHAVIGRRILASIAGYGYPTRLILADLARNVPPRTANADAGMLEVLPDRDVSYDADGPFRILVVAHIEQLDGLDELVARLGALPAGYDVVVTIAEEAWRAAVTDAFHRTARHGSFDLRVVPRNVGADMSAFFVACADVVRSDDHDLIVKVHTRTPAKRSANVVRYFRRYEWDNLFASEGYVRNLLALFQREEGLGIVFPPPIHIGYSTVGNTWGPYRWPAYEMTERLGIRVPFDGPSPLAPLGGMFIARPEALRPFTEVEWAYEDYETSKRRKEPTRKVQERLFAYAAGERGLHTRTVLTREHAALSHLSLEYKLDQLASTTPGYPVEQIQFLRSLGHVNGHGPVTYLRMYLRRNHFKTLHLFYPVWRVTRWSAGALRDLARAARPGAARRSGS
jgi:rhamnosyltransferase